MNRSPRQKKIAVVEGGRCTKRQPLVEARLYLILEAYNVSTLAHAAQQIFFFFSFHFIAFFNFYFP